MSRYIVKATYVPRKAKTTYNLEWREYIASGHNSGSSAKFSTITLKSKSINSVFIRIITCSLPC
jgi:hypothetical protein